MPYENLKKACDDIGLTMEISFLPHSKSRNAGKPDLCLNWKFSLGVPNSRLPQHTAWFLQDSDYSQGIGHMPGYRSFCSIHQENMRKIACEQGCIPKEGYGDWVTAGSKLKPPSREAILECLLLDATALDFPCYEEWARDFGYDEDSRAGERIYRESLGIALKLRHGIGEAGLEKLRQALDRDNDPEQT